MTRSVFSALAAFVIFTGLVLVVSAARRLRRRLPVQATAVAIGCLTAYAIAVIARPGLWPVPNLAVLVGAIGAVMLLERGLGTASSVAVFLAVAAVVDIASVSGGLSRALIEGYRAGTSDILLYLTLSVPVRGRIIPIVGIGDLMVGGAAAVALLRLGFRWRAVMGTISVGLLGALTYGLWRGPAPALPFIAVAVFGWLWTARRLVRRGARARGLEQSHWGPTVDRPC